MQHGGIGHNSAAFAEDLRDDIETVLSDDHKKLFHYAQWHIDDYIAGTVGMQLETEGAYIRFLMRLYQRGKPLPDDDRFMATCMSLSIRVWKRVKDALVAVGKIIVKAGCLTNARFEKERQRRADQLRKMADAARKRHENAREVKAGSGQTSAKLPQSLPEVSPKLSANSPEKPNEINVSIVTTQPYARRLETRELKEEEPPLFPLEGEKQKRARQFPKEWLPSKSLFEWAISEKIGASSEQVAEQFEAFRDYHVAKGNRFVDWDRAFQTWMRNAKQRGHLNGNRYRQHANGSNYSLSGNYSGKTL